MSDDVSDSGTGANVLAFPNDPAMRLERDYRRLSPEGQAEMSRALRIYQIIDRLGKERYRMAYELLMRFTELRPDMQTRLLEGLRELAEGGPDAEK